MRTPVKELLQAAKIAVAPQTFALVSLGEDEWARVLSSPSSSPRMTVPFMVLKDGHEVTLMLDDDDLASLRTVTEPRRIERGFRLMTFDIELDFEVTGFLAEIARVLAEANVPIIAISAFSRDHLLIKQENLAPALRALSEHVDEVC